MSGETGGGIARLTRSRGSTLPPCSVDGRLLAFLSSQAPRRIRALY
jgi:hypothetical protein